MGGALITWSSPRVIITIAAAGLVVIVVGSVYFAAPRNAPTDGPPVQAADRLLPRSLAVRLDATVDAQAKLCGPENGWQVLAGDRTAPGQFSDPSSVALDGEGNLYVADSGNDRIQKLSPTGEPMAQWGAPGSGPGQLDAPSGVALDDRGNLFVADTGNHRIQKLSP